MLNVAVLMGRLTGDPEIRVTPDGKKVASFSVACDRDFKNRDGERQTDFLNIVAWEKTAEFLEKYFHKGDLISIEGRIQARQYQDRNGNNRTAVEIVARNVFFAGGKKDTEPGQKMDSVPQKQPSFTPAKDDGFALIDDEEDLPF